jgi:hypothetical protein
MIACMEKVLCINYLYIKQQKYEVRHCNSVELQNQLLEYLKNGTSIP